MLCDRQQPNLLGDLNQGQFGGLQPQYTAMPMQPQFTSFNPYQQQAQQEAMQVLPSSSFSGLTYK